MSPKVNLTSPKVNVILPKVNVKYVWRILGKHWKISKFPVGGGDPVTGFSKISSLSGPLSREWGCHSCAIPPDPQARWPPSREKDYNPPPPPPFFVHKSNLGRGLFWRTGQIPGLTKHHLSAEEEEEDKENKRPHPTPIIIVFLDLFSLLFCAFLFGGGHCLLPPNRPRKQPQPSRVFWLVAL